MVRGRFVDADQVTMKPVISISAQIFPHLLQYCQSQALTHIALVADQHTYAALGKQIAEQGKQCGLDVQCIVLSADPVQADEFHLVQILIRSDRAPRAYLAVGSGTLTDLVRLVCLTRNLPFISIPTAPSVDAFTSTGAALTLGRSKQTVPAIAPQAIFADLPTLCAAPRPMIAAGFADLLGKFTALADWQLGHFVWGERYDAPIAARASAALRACLAQTDAIARASAEGVQGLIAALFESGQCIADFGSSESASGSEHHLSHYWEMKLLWENRQPLLHGAKVGVAAILIAERYAKLHQLTYAEVCARLDSVAWARAAMLAQIRAGYGASAEAIVAGHAPFLDLDADNLGRVKQRVRANWDRIQAIAATVPTPADLARYLRQIEAPTTPQELGLTKHDVTAALTYADYLRNRFTILKLNRLLGIEP